MERLLVGSMDVAHDYALLKQHGVTHILNVACGIANLFTDELEYLKVDMYDEAGQDFLQHYDKFEEFIDRGRAKGSVLVHCNAGRSRSSSVALAYVMYKERIPLEMALKRLRETRPEVQPNEGFLQQLKRLEEELGINDSAVSSTN